MTKFLGEEPDEVASSEYMGNVSVEQLRGGGWIYTWRGGGIDSYYLHVQRYDADGEKLGDALSLGLIGNYVVTATADGGWLIDGIDYSTSPGVEVALRFDDEGNQIDVDEAADMSFQKIEGLANGGWLGVREEVDGDGVRQLVQYRYGADGEALGSGTVIASPPGYKIGVDITSLEGGGWVVTWGAAQWGLRLVQQQFTSDGVATGPLRELGTISDSANKLPVVTALEDGGWVTGFGVGEYGFEVHFQRYDADGQEVGEPIVFPARYDAGIGAWTVQGLEGGGWAVAWGEYDAIGDGGYSLRAQAFDASNHRMGNAYVVTTDTAKDLISEPRIAALGDGSFAVSWLDDDGIRQRVYHTTEQNTAPVAVADRGHVREGRFVDLAPLLNDSDADAQDILSMDSLVVAKGYGEILYDRGRYYFEDQSDYLRRGQTTTVVLEYTVSDGFETDTGHIKIEVRGRASDGDLFRGSEKADHLKGLEFDETFLGLGGNDTIDGGDGDDFLAGGLGRDQLYAGLGKDTLIGGKGDDTLVGGASGDTFIFSPGDGRDVIVQQDHWEAGRDWLDLTAFGFTSFNQVERLTEEKGHDLIIDLPGKDRLEIIHGLDDHMSMMI